MTKLCPRGKAAAKRKFKVYPSAYANAYASKICAGKIKDPSGTKRKDWGPKKASKGRMFTAAQVRALDESTGSKVNPKKKERIMQSGDKDKIKLSKTNLKRYSTGMSYKDMEPYGGKYAKKKSEMTAKASENVKRLTTQPSAYDPEKRYVIGTQRKGNSRRVMVRTTTDQVNLKEAANKLKGTMGPGTSVGVFDRKQAINARYIRPESDSRSRKINVKKIGNKPRAMSEVPKSERKKFKKYSDGGMARGMGAAIKGGKFEGVF